jgi:hypothetical protein
LAVVAGALGALDLEKMDRKRTRASRGVASSAAWARTRALKASRLMSRLKNFSVLMAFSRGGEEGCWLGHQHPTVRLRLDDAQ